MLAHGNKRKNIFVVNSADASLIPETRLLAASNNDRYLVKKAKLLTRLFNVELTRIVKRIEHKTKLDLVIFDLHGYFNKLLKNSNAYAYTNTVDGCVNIELSVFNPACDSGLKINEFFFFDDIHVTGRVQERISRAMFAEAPEG